MLNFNSISPSVLSSQEAFAEVFSDALSRKAAALKAMEQKMYMEDLSRRLNSNKRKNSEVITEGAPVFDINKLDSKFLSRVENCSTLNLFTADFLRNANRKKEIQYIIKKRFFPNFDLSKCIAGDIITDKDANDAIAALKKQNPENFAKLFQMSLDGIGPGEAMLYFIYNEAYIYGGGSKTGDIEMSNGKIYECKGIKIVAARPNEINDLRLGGTVDTTSIVARIKALYKEQIDSNFEVGAKGSEGAQGTEPINALRTNPKTKEKFKKIESDYQVLANEYFNLHEFILFNNSAAAEEIGKIMMPIGKIKKDAVRIERVTQNGIKPVILKKSL